ncbi:hypothetical protein LCGC14_1887380 [marine sediment metagenome]|uniref:Uncharacterized protein n=1 Tax=marine sediment metagenome TaxID=412755 RepID=A0A0F9IEC0_9ZZZZ
MDKVIKKLCELEDRKLIKWKIRRRGNIIAVTIEETKQTVRKNSLTRNVGGKQVHLIELNPFYSRYKHHISMAHWNNARKQYSEIQIIKILENTITKNRKLK